MTSAIHAILMSAMFLQMGMASDGCCLLPREELYRVSSVSQPTLALKPVIVHILPHVSMPIIGEAGRVAAVRSQSMIPSHSPQVKSWNSFRYFDMESRQWFTDLQRALLWLLAQGYTLHDIAMLRHKGIHCIHKNLITLYRKIGVSGCAEAKTVAAVTSWLVWSALFADLEMKWKQEDAYRLCILQLLYIRWGKSEPRQSTAYIE
jgi:DNA-binding CsgD family transcriptional regulator